MIMNTHIVIKVVKLMRLDYKLTSLALQCFDDSLPSYLSSLLSIYQPSQSLKSSDEKLFSVPRVSN